MARTSVAKKVRASAPRRNSRRIKSTKDKVLEIPFLDRRMTMKSFMSRIRSNPIAMYLGGSVAAVFLVRWGYHFYKDHPEIKEFILDNFDTVEDKLKEYRNSFGSDMSDARH